MTATSRLTTGLVLFLCTSGPAGAQTPPLLGGLPSIALQATTSVSQSGAPTQSPSAGPGRVVVTIVTDSLRIPAVTVELRNADANIRVGQTTSDAVGQVTFPDVPPGTLHRARRARRVRRQRFRAVHGCSPGETDQVLVEMRLTFVRESVDVVVPANSPTESLQPVAVSDVLTGAKMDIQPLAGDDFQSLLTVLPERHPRSRRTAARQGRRADDGRAADEQREPQRPVDGRFRSRAAQRRGGIGRGAVESVRRRVRPFLDQRHAGAHQARHQRMDRSSPTTSSPASARASRSSTSSSRGCRSPGRSRRDRLLFGQYLQYRFVRTPVKSLPGEPQLGLDSFDSFTRLDAVLSSRHALTGGVIYFPRKITNATLSTFRPPETTPTFTQSGFSAGRRSIG